MSPLPRPFLRFAVGTTLLVPAVGSGCDNDPPPTINTPAPETEKQLAPTGEVVEANSGAPDDEDRPKVNTPPDTDLKPPVVETINTPAPDPEPESNLKVNPGPAEKEGTDKPPKKERPPVLNVPTPKRPPPPT